jgi:hypothetical protein
MSSDQSASAPDSEDDDGEEIRQSGYGPSQEVTAPFTFSTRTPEPYVWERRVSSGTCAA